MTAEIIPLLKIPSKPEAQKIVRLLVAEGCVAFHPHAKTRLKQRKITSVEVLTVLQKGAVVENPVQDLSHKGWKTNVRGGAAGRQIEIVVCLRWQQDVLIITCF